MMRPGHMSKKHWFVTIGLEYIRSYECKTEENERGQRERESLKETT